MCIRDRVNMVVVNTVNALSAIYSNELSSKLSIGSRIFRYTDPNTCLLYTSDAADERSSVDLGGRRIIKKKKKSNSSV